MQKMCIQRKNPVYTIPLNKGGAIGSNVNFVLLQDLSKLLTSSAVINTTVLL